ncbi:MAG TPA: HIRAN domain-containing protein [Solirubrobacteraceae bacterium]|nr:HIRAN domain-containing protein [Solirubrobacteraceae bacterium]
MTPESPETPETPADGIAVRVLKDTHTFYGHDGSAWWSGGYAPIGDDGEFLALADHATSDPRVLFCAVAGAKHRPAALQDARFQPRSELLLQAEPDNPHDADAVGVWDQAGEVQVGYVPAELSAAVAAELRAGKPVSAMVVREIRQDSDAGARVTLHMIFTSHGALSLAIVSDPHRS